MIRDRFLQLLGPLPDKVPAALTMVAEVDCGSYVRHTIEYTVEAGERIRAFLCVPKGEGKKAAVFCHHQHAGNRLLGKSEVVGLAGDPDQAYAAELAGRGFITLAPDAVCFEERCSHPDEPNYAHLNALHQRLIRGQTLLGKVLHDVSVGIDVLQKLPNIHSQQIGFIGHSYGGRMALFAPVFDRRIKASVCNCGSTNFRDMTGIQFDFVVPNFLSYGDVEDIVRLVEPTSLLILGGSKDKWSLGVEAMILYAQSAFKRGRLESAVYEVGHAFTLAMREQAYLFLAEELSLEK